MTQDLFYLVKLVSNRDPSPTSPPVEFIWGITVIYTINPVDYKEDSKENKAKFYWLSTITRKKISVFDTRQHIDESPMPPKRHLKLFCELGDKCPEHFERVIHI